MADFADSYLDPDTGILRNLVGARTQALLDAAEADIAQARRLTLAAEPIPPSADLAELRAIHRHLFQDVYEWAGQLRRVDLRKSVQGAVHFLPVSAIERAAGFAAIELAQDGQLTGLGRRRFVERLAHHYDQFNYIHPFREGNGRAQRAFWDRIARDAGWRIDWLQATGEMNDEASRVASELGDLGLLVKMFDRIVVPLQP